MSSTQLLRKPDAPPVPTRERRVLVLGAEGSRGKELVSAFWDAGWAVRGDCRDEAGSSHIELVRPRAATAAIDGADLLVSAVAERALSAERLVLERGGLLINVAATPAAAA